MGIKSLKIFNLLSFDEFVIDNIKDINCIIGVNNVGKSNLLKLLRFFYDAIEEKRVLPPELFSNYNAYGEITVEYDLERLSKIVTADRNSNKPFLKYIQKVLSIKRSLLRGKITKSYVLSLKIYSNNVISWSTNDKKVLPLINLLFPFFEIETRHLDLYNWDELWNLISKLRSFNINKLDNNLLSNVIDEQISGTNHAYLDYIEKIKQITKTSKYSYKEKVLNYVKVGLDGQNFNIDGDSLFTQSDGTNSFNYLEKFLRLVIALTRRDYISPTVYIDEPEIGLHPSRSEELIFKIFETYMTFRGDKSKRQKGKYITPYPKILFATHSPNIVKMVIKLFSENQQIISLTKQKRFGTKATIINSFMCRDSTFINIFSDNDARLFFSKFIFFVEGETELEIFSNLKLHSKFPHLKQIEIYPKASNSVLLRNINPSNSNLAIPYLVLLDADKVFEIDFQKRVFVIKKKSDIKITALVKRYKYSYPNSPYYDRKKLLDELLKKVNNPFVFNKNKTYFIKENKFFNLISELNNILVHENYRLVSTTIENLLINDHSYNLFISWIKFEIEKYINIPKDRQQGLAVILRFLEKINSVNVIDVFNKKLVYTENSVHFDDIDLITFNSYKSIYIKKIFNNFHKKFHLKKDKVISLRLLFCGKTDTLISRSNDKYSEISSEYRKKIEELKEKDLKLISPLFYKTSGWVSKFINFSIENIKDNDQEDFEQSFKCYFPELYDIIYSLQLR